MYIWRLYAYTNTREQSKAVVCNVRLYKNRNRTEKTKDEKRKTPERKEDGEKERGTKIGKKSRQESECESVSVRVRERGSGRKPDRK